MKHSGIPVLNSIKNQLTVFKVKKPNTKIPILLIFYLHSSSSYMVPLQRFWVELGIGCELGMNCGLGIRYGLCYLPIFPSVLIMGHFFFLGCCLLSHTTAHFSWVLAMGLSFQDAAQRIGSRAVGGMAVLGGIGYGLCYVAIFPRVLVVGSSSFLDASY